MFRTLDEAQAFLRTRTDYERQDRAHGWRPDLDPIRRLCAALGNPERGFRVLHVGGTKGKGSTATFAVEILRAGGIRTGLTTSPHLERLTERIVVDGEEIAGEAFASALGGVVAAVERCGVKDRATVFDLLTAAAFAHFREERVAWAVVEVGLGGRLDSTNVVAPEVCALTNVSLEHTEVLGNRIEDIAREKAGIVKEGVPVVTGFEGAAFEVLEKVCRKKKAPLLRSGRDFGVERAEVAAGGLEVEIRGVRARRLRARLPGPGVFQAENLALALAAIEVLVERGALPGFDVAGALAAAEPNLRVPGRFEVFAGSPPVVIDGAHTPESVAAAARSLAAAFPGRRAAVVFAARRDKDLRGMLSRLRGCADTVFATAVEEPRAAAPEVVADAAREAGLRVETAGGPREALDAARGRAAGDGVVLVLGSLYLAGALRPALAGGTDGEDGREETC